MDNNFDSDRSEEPLSPEIDQEVAQARSHYDFLIGAIRAGNKLPEESVLKAIGSIPDALNAIVSARQKAKREKIPAPSPLDKNPIVKEAMQVAQAASANLEPKPTQPIVPPLKLD